MWVAGAMSTPLGDLLEPFLNAQDIRPSSQQTYRRSLEQFLRWLEQEGIHKPTRQDLMTYKRHLQTRGLSSLTVASYLVAIRRFFAWTQNQNHYPNIADGLKGTRRPNGFRKDPLTADQVGELLRYIDRNSLQGERDFALLNLLVRTGLRTIEVVRANVGDLEPRGRNVLFWVQGKGQNSKDEFVVLTEASLMPLKTYLAARGPVPTGAPLFTSLSDRNCDKRLTARSISRIVRRYLLQSGLQSRRITPHSLRHTAVTFALQGGATIQEAQALARHASINTTLIYAHNLERLRRVPERCVDQVLAGALRGSGVNGRRGMSAIG